MEGVDHGTDANFFVDHFVDKMQYEEERMESKEQFFNVGETKSASGNVVLSILVENPIDSENVGMGIQVDALLGRSKSPSVSVNMDNQVLECADRGYQPVPLVHNSPSLQKSVPKKRGRASSCPPRPARSIVSGPWSLEWLTDQHHSEAGVVSSARKVGKKLAQSRKQMGQSDIPNQNRK